MIDPLANVRDHTGDRKWAYCPNTIRAHYEALDRVIDLAHNEPYAGHDSDFGIVYVGGGRYWPGIVVGVRLLRHIGYRGPIEVWRGHYADEEPIRESDVAGYDVRIVDTREVAKTTQPRILRGWEAKLHAIRHSRFRRVLFLDADAYCVVDPTPYFDRFSDFAFWSENRQNIRWHYVWPSHDRRDVIGVQGGQFFVDRETAWPLVVIADWICQHSDFYFQHVYGDQDAWRLALAITELPYTIVGPATWHHPAFVCAIENRKFVVHRPVSKLFRACDWNARDCAVDFAPHLPFETFVWREFAKLAEHEIEECESAFACLYRRGATRVFDSPSPDDRAYLACIETLAKTHSWTKIIDLGCGNGRITKEITRRTGVEVVGLDCVREILPESDLSNLRFEYANAFEIDSIPDGDALLVKDVLAYWPFAHVRSWLREIVARSKRERQRHTKWRHIVVTNDVLQFPSEMPFGRHHGINPELCDFLHGVEHAQIRLENKAILLISVR